MRVGAVRNAIISIVFAFVLPLALSAQESAPTSTDPELIAATALLRDGQLAAAKGRFLLLVDSQDWHVRFESRFQLGMIASVEKDYPAAIKRFLSILAENPTLARVRLELAKAYFLSGNYSEAAYHFQFVKADGSAPKDVLERVDEFIEAARRQKNWSVAFAVGIAPDTNLNTSGGGRQCVLTVFGQFCTEPNERNSGFGLRVLSTVNYYLRLTEDWGIRSTVGLSATDYPMSRYDDYILSLASGPRYIFGSGEVSLQPTYSRRWLYGKEFNQAAGVRSDANWDIAPQWVLGIGASALHNLYDNPQNSAYQGNTYAFYITPRYVIDNRSFVNLDMGYARDSLNASEHSADSYTLGAGYFIQSAFGLAFSANVSATRVLHDAPNLSYDELYLYDQDTWDYIGNSCKWRGGFMLWCYKPKRDTVWQSNFSIMSEKWNLMGLFPSLRYTFIKRESTINMHEYERHRVEVLANMKF